MDRLILPTLLCCLIAYLLCGIPFGLLITKAMGIDVRAVGSGNIGTTNVARAAGKGASALTLLLDAGKGYVSMTIARLLIPALAEVEVKALGFDQPLGFAVVLVYAACICGHVFSCYLRFKGGKGIAVGFGAALGLKWQLAFGLLAVFIAVVAPTRYVSLASCSAAVSLPIWALVFGIAPVSLIPLCIVSGIVVWAHRSNIKKLLNHEEKKFSFNSEKKS